MVRVSSERSSSSSTTKTWEGHAATACCTFCNWSRDGCSWRSSTTPSLSRWVNTWLAARTQAPLAIHRLVKAITFMALSFLFYEMFSENLLLLKNVSNLLGFEGSIGILGRGRCCEQLLSI